MPEYWILRGRTPVPTEDLLEWVQSFENIDGRRVRRTQLGPNITVSTVFLGLDHNWRREGPPILFETMAFLDEKEAGCWRCSTWDEAEAQHEQAVEDIKKRTGFQPMSTEEFFEQHDQAKAKERPTVWQHLIDDEDT